MSGAGACRPRTSARSASHRPGTNHLGHFALVAHPLPLLRAGRGRVTSQISVAANQHAINWGDPNWERS